jgi:cardiolipin synthase A/B
MEMLSLSGWTSSWPAWLGTAVWLTSFLVGVALLGIIPRDRKPSSAMAWLLAIFVLPVVGLVLYFLLGSHRVGRARNARQAEATAKIHDRASGVPPALGVPPGAEYLRSVTTLNLNLGSLPALEGNSVELYSDYRESVTAMTTEVEAAQSFVHVQFYITAWDEVTGPFFEALLAATARGVHVRLLFDHLGSRAIPGYHDMIDRLGSSSIDWRPMLPVQPLKGELRRPDLRNHRKILVVDGTAAFMGSQNLIEPGYDKDKNHKAGREWVELMTRIEGPVVAALNAVFATDWYGETGDLLAGEIVPRDDLHRAGEVACQIIPSGPGFPTENNLRAFTTLIYSAQRRLSLTSPYFVPDESLLYAVTTAAQRGVAVELFVSEEGDQFMVYHAQCSYYRELLMAGVRIYLYPAPYVLHSKHFSIDDDVAVIGSSNMDMRSFLLNYEVSAMFHGSDIVSRVRKVEDEYRSICRELTLQEWNSRGGAARYLDNLMRLTAALQ